MAKKTKSDVQPEAVVEQAVTAQVSDGKRGAAPKSEGGEKGAVASVADAAGKEKKPAGVETSEGRLIYNVKVVQNEKKDGLVLNAMYGTGDKKEDKAIRNLPLSAEQSVAYQRLSSTNGKEYADNHLVREMLPMFLDDKKYNKMQGEVGGRAVDYVFIQKLKAEDLPEDKKGYAGRFQVTYGQSKASVGEENAWKKSHILTREEVAMAAARSQVTLVVDGKNKKGNPVYQVAALGSPVTKLDIANIAAARVAAKEKQTEYVSNMDWSKYKFPEGANVTKLHFEKTRDPERLKMVGDVNGVEVSGILSKNETMALRNKNATFEQVAAANNEFSKKVIGVLKPVMAVEQAAVKAVVDRASDPAAKSFTPEQHKAVAAFAAGADDRVQIFDKLFEKAKPELDKAGINEAWQKDVRDELKDLAEGIVRENQQGISR